MTGKGNAHSRPAVSWSDRQIRQHGAGALRYAKQKELATQRDLAAWTNTPERTVRNQLAGRSVLTFKVFGSGRLRRHILHYLSVCDRAVKKTLPHVLRAKRRAR